jgi:hypothetical protein
MGRTVGSAEAALRDGAQSLSGRESRTVDGTLRQPGCEPIYPVVHQTGVELQLVVGTGLLKADIVRVRSPERHAFIGFTVGAEMAVDARSR